jgi:hypothetical protein
MIFSENWVVVIERATPLFPVELVLIDKRTAVVGGEEISHNDVTRLRFGSTRKDFARAHSWLLIVQIFHSPN